MKINTSLTIYHKEYDKTTRLDKYVAYYIENAMWQGGKGASINQGYLKDNSAKIYIPYQENEGLNKIPLSIGDVIVKGTCYQSISKASELNCEYFNINTIIKNDYGSIDINHIMIGAK